MLSLIRFTQRVAITRLWFCNFSCLFQNKILENDKIGWCDLLVRAAKLLSLRMFDAIVVGAHAAENKFELLRQETDGILEMYGPAFIFSKCAHRKYYLPRAIFFSWMKSFLCSYTSWNGEMRTLDFLCDFFQRAEKAITERRDGGGGARVRITRKERKEKPLKSTRWPFQRIKRFNDRSTSRTRYLFI